MTVKQKDRHLETPSEANRDKHINFLAEEQGDINPADEEVNHLRDKSDKKQDEEDGLDNGFFDEEQDDEKGTKK